ncbi:hypothetical protein HK105_205266 [Polyrhizophydium stewartii]|uniref:Receptor ligand binding region domain-containing protein n=1 Tax=Polyrhizophydium stewartii TaxID=2732419 RepID=A0ABR4N6L5_9FUNG
MRASRLFALLGAALAWMLPAAAPARVADKTANNITVLLIDGGLTQAADQAFFGMHMAASEINANPSVLPDATLQIRRVVIYDYSAPLAEVYDLAVEYCDDSIVNAMFGALDNDRMVGLVCPQLSHFAAYDDSDVIDNKKIYPLYYRTVETRSQDVLMCAAVYKHFGWTRIGFVSTSAWMDKVPIYIAIFMQHGISVLESASIDHYNPSISKYYYPQLRRSFERLKMSKLRIFLALVDTSTIIDVMMAANATGMIGRDYFWSSGAWIVYDSVIQDRWENTITDDIFNGLMLVTIPTGPFPEEPSYQDWLPRFYNFSNWTTTNEPSLYWSLDTSGTDPTSPTTPENIFFDDPGTNVITAYCTLMCYDAMTALAHTFEQLITDMNSTAEAVANRTLLSSLTLSRLTSPFAQIPSVFGVTEFTSQGDPELSPGLAVQYKTMTAAAVVGSMVIDPITKEIVVSIDNSTFVWGGGRAFNDTPIDFPPPDEDFVDLRNPGVRLMLALAAATAAVCLAAGVAVLGHQSDGPVFRQKPRYLATIALGFAVIQGNSATLVGRDNASLLITKAFQLLIFNQEPAIVNMIKPKYFPIIQAAQICVSLILIASAAIAPPIRSTPLYIEQFDGYRYVCSATLTKQLLLNVVFAWIVLLLAAVLCLQLLCRDIPDAFNTTRQTSASVILMVILAAICASQSPLETPATTQFYLETGSAVLGALICCLLLLGWPLLEARSQVKRGAKHVLSTNSGSRTRAKLSASDLTSQKASSPISISSAFRPGRAKPDQQRGSIQDTAIKSLPKPEFVVTIEAMPKDVVQELKAHYPHWIVRVPMLKPGVLSQWRTATLVVLPPPVCSLRIVFKDLSNIEFLPLSTLTALRNHMDDPHLGGRMCELRFGTRVVVVCLSDQVKAEAWADTVARCALATCEPPVRVSDGQMVTALAAKPAAAPHGED